MIIQPTVAQRWRNLLTIHHWGTGGMLSGYCAVNALALSLEELKGPQTREKISITCFGVNVFKTTNLIRRS